MYRIVQARSGYYYVQQDMGSTWHSDWSKCSPFYATMRQARTWVKGIENVLANPLRLLFLLV